VLQDTPVGITRLSEEIVLWRDADGAVHAVEDSYLHRGARLSLGRNLGDHVACWYHGAQINGQGVVVDVPAVNSCSLKGKTCLKSYPAVESNSAIFLWFGDSVGTPVTPFSLPQEMTSQDYSGFLCMQNWKCNYRYTIDNVMDLMHGRYLHASSHSMDEGDTQAEMVIKNTDTGLIFEKTAQKGVNFDWVEFGETAAIWLRLAVPYKEKYGGEFMIVGFATPVNDQNCRVYFWRLKKASGLGRNIWRFLYRNRLEGLHWDVVEQDRVVLETTVGNARAKEGLYRHDVGLVRVRRMMEQIATDQAEQACAAA
jgi:phenylpropionate dioxygenase-like ring-hydroxylating dioxygenase large terminal subunit